MTEAITTTGSTVPRRQLGRYLRDLRNSSRLTVRVAAARLEWSEAKIWRIETGQTALRSLDVEAMCKIYGASPETTEGLMGLAKETKARGWWHSYGDVIPEYFDVYIGLEEAASQISWYESELVPGLLQTEDYARAVIEAHNPGLDNAQIEQRVRVRIARQALLTRVTSPPVLQLVLNEAILRRPIGNHDVMARQLERLAEAGRLPTASIRVIPFSAGLHCGVMSGPFEILRFPLHSNGQTTEPPIVYVESLTGALYLDKHRELDRYNTTFTNIWETALDEQASQELITQVTRELGT
ncbi:MAG TPA: helix-turn-helix transcriptional regulator [Pseudonocardiaceae bacterium]|nr:helix-turn-helix transcriptional regulator [Pseudonocardiaceae bacterium]